MEKSCTHGSHRNEWRWCPGRCSVARSDPSSPASESGSSRVSPFAPSHGSRRVWIRSPAGTWTKPLALLLTPGGGRRAETPGTPRSKTDHRDHRAGDPSEEEQERSRWRLRGWGRGTEGWRGPARMVTFTHGCTLMQSLFPPPLRSLIQTLSLLPLNISPLHQQTKHAFPLAFSSPPPQPVHPPTPSSPSLFEMLSSPLILWCSHNEWGFKAGKWKCFIVFILHRQAYEFTSYFQLCLSVPRFTLKAAKFVTPRGKWII